MLLGLSTPVALAVLVFFAYALIVFRERDTSRGARRAAGPRPRERPAVVDRSTTVIVLFLAGYGTVRLLSDGSGGGQGPNPIAKPDAAKASRRSRSR